MYCFQYRPEGRGPVRWYLARVEALLAETEWEWKTDVAEASMLPVDMLEGLKARFMAGEGVIPWLPTQPIQTMPMEITICLGRPSDDMPMPVLPPAPNVLAERHQRHADGIAQAEASTREPKTVAERTAIAKRAARTRALNRIAPEEVFRREEERGRA